MRSRVDTTEPSVRVGDTGAARESHRDVNGSASCTTKLRPKPTRPAAFGPQTGLDRDTALNLPANSCSPR